MTVTRSSTTSIGDTGRVIVVGGGFGGLQAARTLSRRGWSVTLVDRRNYHTFQPLLYQVATAGLEAGSVAYPLRGLSRRHRSLEARTGTVVGADLDTRSVYLAGGEQIAYDYLILAAGATTADFGIPGVAEHAFPLKTLTDAIRLRSHLLGQFERADAHPEEPGLTDVVVIGGGPTGVELCGGLSELIHRVLVRDYPRLDLSKARIVLVEAADRLLGGFHQTSADNALRTLRDRAVDVRLGTAVARVEADRVVLAEGATIQTSTAVWTAGIKANPLGAQLGLALGKAGRVQVRPDLSLPGRPEVFVIGDLAAATDRAGHLYPQLAPVAMQQGRYLAEALDARCRDRERKPFRYLDKGIMATIGRDAAVAELPLGLRLKGRLAWLAWLGLHLSYLIGFRNPAAVLLDWAWNYLTYQWAARLILPVESDDYPNSRKEGERLDQSGA